MKINWKTLIISLIISLGTGIISGLLTMKGIMQFQEMPQPPLTPPGWVFFVVWTILYTLMGIAAYLIYEMPESQERTNALYLYGIQLLLNAAWVFIFFGAEAYFLAVACLILLWIFIYLTTKSFLQLNKTAGSLMVPYLLWVTFAGYLNLAVAFGFVR